MKPLSLIILSILVTSFSIQNEFLNEQKKFERVRNSLRAKGKSIDTLLKAKGLNSDKLNILILAFKDEDILEIYAKKTTENTYKLLYSYEICSKSGELGPKRKKGDNQVPEGFYHIDRFNPNSSFYLSLGLNYPNKADKIKSRGLDPGGDIFIHGSCVTIGCMPMTDEKIKEIYLYAVYARNSGQNRIPVYVFPYRMGVENFAKFKTRYSKNPELIRFWTSLKGGYDLFFKDKKELNIKVNEQGDYLF